MHPGNSIALHTRDSVTAPSCLQIRFNLAWSPNARLARTPFCYFWGFSDSSLDSQRNWISHTSQRVSPNSHFQERMSPLLTLVFQHAVPPPSLLQVPWPGAQRQPLGSEFRCTPAIPRAWGHSSAVPEHTCLLPAPTALSTLKPGDTHRGGWTAFLFNP